MHRKIFYFLLFLALCPVLINAGTKGRIKGKVVDLQTGEALIGANVVIVGSSAGANTDMNGEYLIQNLDPGVYTLKASYVGYQTITISNVRVNADLTQETNFELPSQDIQVGQVDIVARRPIIQKDNTNAVRITTNEDIQSMPIRGFNNIFALNAGVSVNTDNNGNQEFHVRGGREDETGFYVEGVSVRNPRGGGRAVAISQDAIEEMQVQAGGYTAEFGGANSGIVRTTLRSGGTQFKASVEYITDNVTFKSAKDAYDGKKTPFGTYWWGYDETSASISGPLFDQRFKFFFNVNYQFNRDIPGTDMPGVNLGLVWDQTVPAAQRDTVNWVFNSGPVPKRARKTYTFTGTMNFDLKPLLFRVTGTYFLNNNTTYGNNINVNTNHFNFMNDRPGEFASNNGTLNFKMTHVLSPSLFYELSAGYVFSNYEQMDSFLKGDYWSYGDSVANAAVGWVWTRRPQDLARPHITGVMSRFSQPRAYQVFGWNFNRPEGVNVGYQKNKTTSLSFAGSLNWLPNKYHTIKLGGDYQTWTYRNFVPAYDAAALYTNSLPINNPTGLTIDQIKANYEAANGSNIYGYDYFGNEIDGSSDKMHAPFQPVFASAYLQDKIEYEDVILNVGLRYDYIDTDVLEMVDKFRPDLSIVKSNNNLIPDGWQKVATFSAVSPRIGLSFPVTDKTVFHAQYGKFVQQPDLNQSLVGYDAYASQLSAGLFISTTPGPSLRPTRTTQYELGLNQQIADFMSFDVTAYYKDIKDLVQMVPVVVPAANNQQITSYYERANVDFATTRGLELTINMRRFERISVNGSITLQDSKGTGSYPNSARGIVGAYLSASGGPFFPKNISPLEFDRPFKSNLAIDYRFGDNDGPALLHSFGINVLLTYQSGRPFTLADPTKSSVSASGNSTQGNGDARDRVPGEPLGTSNMPAFFNVDFKIDKTFTILDKLSANIYVTVLNLFNNLNVDNVYLYTGTNTDDGYLSNPLTYQSELASKGQTYIDMYNAVMARNGFTSPMRQIRLGIRLEY